MKNYWPLLILLLIAAGALLAGTPAMGQEASGTITGVVFHDRDEDGTQDPGEEGLSRDVVLKPDGATLGSTGNGVDGTFTLEAAPGRYDLTVELDERQGGCADVFSFSFHPLAGSYCVGAPLPWTATMPSTVPVTVGDGQTVEVNFGARPTEAAVIVGRAVLEDRRAPSGTRIEALVNGLVCGTSTVLADSGVDFVINVLGEREREGCASRGAVVSFRVGGVQATETASWVPYAEVENFLQIDFVSLAAMEHHAWYWMEVPAAGLPGDGAPVLAMVGDTICGQTTIRTTQALRVFPPDQAGFSRLIGPSAEVQPGCGRAGATVTFTIDGRPAGSIPWQPGLQEIELDLRLPDTGSGGRSVRSSSGMGLVVLGVLGVLTLGAGGLLLRRR